MCLVNFLYPRSCPLSPPMTKGRPRGTKDELTAMKNEVKAKQPKPDQAFCNFRASKSVGRPFSKPQSFVEEDSKMKKRFGQGEEKEISQKASTALRSRTKWTRKKSLEILRSLEQCCQPPPIEQEEKQHSRPAVHSTKKLPKYIHSQSTKLLPMLLKQYFLLVL